MIFYMNLISIVIAVSLDGFGVGITYGMRRMKISIGALFVIISCSGMIVIVSMMIGHLLKLFISPTITKVLGSSILIMLGIFVFISIIRPKQMKQQTDNSSNTKWHHVKTVLSKPIKADKDRSGTISMSEAIALGIALALDAFGAGLGAAMLGYSPWITSLLIATMSGVFVYSGLKLGYLLAGNKILSRLTFLPPFLLIAIGVYNLF